MPVLGFQDLWLTGSRLYFKRDDIDGVDQPVIDLGIIDPVNPQIQVNDVRLYDSDGGIRQLAARAVTQIDETYQAKCSNINSDILALMFMSTPVEAVTVAGTAVTGTTEHYAHEGKLLKIKDNSGNYVWGVASIEAVKDGATTHVLGTDYEIYNLERGIIRIIDGAGITTGDMLTIDYTPRAITAEKRLFKPQTSVLVNGTAFLVYGRDNNTRQSVREARVSVTPAGTAFDNQNYSSVELKLEVLNDLTSTSNPAGRFYNWLGTLPSLS